MCLPRSLPPALRPSSPPPSPPLPSRPHRRNASGKANEAKKKDPSKVKGTNDGGEAKMDKELVLYEFINLLVRIAFQRANPTYGNFGNKREVVPPPGCLEEMITTCILPNARRDTSAEFKETVMQDEAVKGVLAEYKDKLKAWYTKFCAEDTLQSDKLGMEQFLRYCNEKDVIGIWTVLQQSDINGDPNAGFEHKFKLSIPTVKTAFMDSQNQSQIGAAQASNVDEMAVLDFEPEVRRDASWTAPHTLAYPYRPSHSSPYSSSSASRASASPSTGPSRG